MMSGGVLQTEPAVKGKQTQVQKHKTFFIC